MPLSDATYLRDEQYPLRIRFMGLKGQSLSPSEYQELLNILYKDTFADPAYVQKSRDEVRQAYLQTEAGKKYPDAPLATGGVGDPVYEAEQADSYKKYVQKELEKAGITQAQPRPSDPEVNPQPTIPNTPTAPVLPGSSNTLEPQPVVEQKEEPAVEQEEESVVEEQQEPLTEAEQYQKEKDALLEKAKENQPVEQPGFQDLVNEKREEKEEVKPTPVEPPAPVETPQEEEKIMPAPSPVEVTPAPGFEDLVNQQRKEQAVEEKKLTTSSPTVEQQAQTTQEAFQGLVNDARTGDTQVAGAPAALALPVGLGIGGAVLTGLGVKEGGQALQNAADNIQELFTPSANVPEESTPNPVVETLQEYAPTMMGIFGLGGKSKTTGPTKATYGGKSQEQIKKEKELEEFKRNLPPATQGQPGRGRGMGDTWEGPQASVTSGQRSEKIASTSSFTEPTRTTGSRSEKLANASSSSSSDSSRTKGSRSDAFGALVNSSREEKLRGFA